MITVFILACKKDTPKEEDLSGSYILKRSGYSYWCDSYHKNGKDSIVKNGYFTFFSQPQDRIELTAVITKIDAHHYSICADNRGPCSDSNFNPHFAVSNDSINFCEKVFNIYNSTFLVYQMKGIRSKNGFKGLYTEYAIQKIPTSSMPSDYIFIGTFELIKK